MAQNVRLYVGGIGVNVESNDLNQLFSSYGSITIVDIKDKKDPEGNLLTRFAYVSIDAIPQKIQQCEFIYTYIYITILCK